MLTGLTTEADQIHMRFVAGKWPLYGDEDVRFLSLALAGEVGELANFIKKRWRGDSIDDGAIESELADINIYLHLLAIAFKCDLNKISREKLKEVEQRLINKAG